MDREDKRPQFFFLSLKDLVGVLSKKRRSIFLGGAGIAFLALMLTLTKPVVFKAEGRFFASPDGEGSSSSMGSGSFFSTLVGMSQDNPSAIGIMNSDLILDPLVEEGALQLRLHPLKTKSKAAHIYENLKVAYAHYKKRRRPVTTPEFHPLICLSATYLGDVPVLGRATFKKDGAFTLVVDGEVHEGNLGIPVEGKNFSITLAVKEEANIKGETYSFDLVPKHTVIRELSKGFIIESDADNPNILDIAYSHPDRDYAVFMVNELMRQYQVYLKKKSKERSEVQLAYLNTRKKETRRELEADLQELADNSRSEIESAGFASSADEGAFLSSQLEALRKRGFEIDLTMDHLLTLKESPGTPSEVMGSEALSALSRALRDLELKKEGLEIALYSRGNEGIKDAEKALESRMEKLSQVSKDRFEVEELLASNAEEGMLPKALRGDAQSKKMIRKNLENKLKTLSLCTRVLEEQIEDPIFLDNTFSGISLDTANSLYLSYNRDLDVVELERKKKEDILEKLAMPDFEISSLSGVLDDSVSQEMIRNVSQLSLKKTDEKNRTEKERERLSQLIDVQRSFLIKHLEESKNLLVLKEDVIKKKIEALQMVTHQLYGKEMSVIKGNYLSQVEGKIDFLRKEKEQIRERVEELKQKMATLPQKKIKEMLLDLEQTVSKTILSDITQLVESKNISHNLEQIESRPVDYAFAPVLPDSPKLFLFLVGGSILGAVFASFLVLGKEFAEGFEATEDTLDILGLNLLGTLYIEDLRQRLNYLTKDNLTSLRRAKALIEKQKGEKEATLILGRGPNYSSYLAALLEKEGKRVKLLSFERETFLVEKLSSPEFKRELEADKNEYDLVLLVFPYLPEEGEAEAIALQSKTLLITLGGEKQNALQRLFALSLEKRESTGFFIAG